MYKQYSAVYTKMFNFRRITLFCLEKTPLKAQNDYIFYKFVGHDPFAPPLATTMLRVPPRKFSAHATVSLSRFLELKIGSLESEKSGPYRSIPGT